MAGSSTSPQPSSTHHQHSFLPVYQSLATVNVGSFVTIKLSGDMKSNNYSSWKLQVLSLIQSHDLLSFIDVQPSYLKTEPTANDGEIYDIWRTDKVLRGWILGTISEPTLLVITAELATAREVWLVLERRFDEKVLGIATAVDGSTQQHFNNVQKPLLKTALTGEWSSAERILRAHPTAAKNSIADHMVVTPLGVAVGTGKAIDFVENLLLYIPDDESIALKNEVGFTALHIAAIVGNTEAATILVRRMPNLCYIPDNSGDFPIHCAAKYAKKEALEYLISATQSDRDPNPYADLHGLQLLTYTIDADFFDIASHLVEKYPYLAGVKSPNGDSALAHLVGRPALSYKPPPFFISYFQQGGGSTRLIVPPARRYHSRRGLFFVGEVPALSIERIVEGIVPALSIERIVEGIIEEFTIQAFRCITALTRKEPGPTSPSQMRKMKKQARELLLLLCHKLGSLDNVQFHKARDIFENAILKAAEVGVRAAVEVIVDIFPISIYANQMPSQQNIFHKAVENRSEDVFSLIYLMSNHKQLFLNITDVEGNNLLHLAGKLAPMHKLNESYGPALQMHREMQWFEEVKWLVHPTAREQKNFAGKTPQMVFTEEHKDLKKEGEKWLKGTATASSISATLIITIMFAAVVQVPGGNSNNGLPNFSKKPAFIVFAISDAVSLFTSTASLLLFLEILTSHFAEEDFRYILPRRLMWGLTALFLSLSSMLVSFSAALYLVFGQGKIWVLILVIVLAVYPLCVLGRLEVSLIVDLISLFDTLNGIVWLKDNYTFF